MGCRNILDSIVRISFMRCRHCRKKYPANVSQPAPGGSSSPGAYFYLAVILITVSVILFAIDVKIWKWVVIGITVFVMTKILVAWSDCRGSGGLAEAGGEKCPHCGGQNVVWPWSL
jgi:hypothetical protein